MYSEHTSRNTKSHKSNYSDEIRKFYKSNDWKIIRAMVIAKAGGRCQRCGAPGSEVHHIIHLTDDNVKNPNISLNMDNLILLCKECHNKEHDRYTNLSDYKFDENGNVIPNEKYKKTTLK